MGLPFAAVERYTRFAQLRHFTTCRISRRGETACPWRSRLPAATPCAKAGADGYAPGSERFLAGVPAWPMLWPLVSFAAAALVIGWPWLSGKRDHPVGRQGDIPAADPISGAESRQRPIAVLVALRLQRPSADRRPPGDDLFSALPPAVSAHLRAQPVGGRCDGAGHGVCRRRGPHAVVSRPGLALGRRARRRARVLLRRLHGLAHPAHRPGAEPRLPADRHGVPRAGAGAKVDPLWRRCGRRRSLHRARPRSGGAARRLSAHRVRALAPALGRPAGGRGAREPPAAVGGRNRRRRARSPCP